MWKHVFLTISALESPKMAFSPTLHFTLSPRISKKIIFFGILGESVNTPYNVGSILRRLFSTAGDSISTAEGSISTAEAVQYCRGIASVLWRDSISTVEGYHQYCGGCSVLRSTEQPPQY